MLDFVVVGRTVWDEWRLAPVYPRSARYADSFGGPGANVAVALAMLGFQCALVTNLGTDARSTLYRQHLVDAGVDLRFAVCRPGALPSCRMTPGGPYEWVDNYDGLEALRSVPTREAITEGRAAVLVEVSDADVGARRAVPTYLSPQLLLRKGACEEVVFDTRGWRAVFLNRGEAELMVRREGRTIAELSVDDPGSFWIVTDEASPTSVYRGGRRRLYSVPPGHCVLSTGGGDAFLAGYCAADRLGLGTRAAVALGHRLASAVVAQLGCQLDRSTVNRIAVEAGIR